MAQTGFTPIQLYFSSTTTNVPLAANLASGELAINITDGKLFYKDNANAVQVIAWKITPTSAGGTGLTSYTAGDLTYYASGTTFTKLGIGSAYQALQVNAGATAPSWQPSASSVMTAQGDLLYASAANTLARLAKDSTATRYLSNTGASNNPAWAQIDLSNGVTGVLPAANGGTGINNSTRTLTVNTNAGTLNFTAASKTLGISNSITLAGTDATTMTFPSTSASVARTDAAQTFTGLQTLNDGASIASSLTLTGGTANGVTYLNGSKVVTSGSALGFDGTNLLVGTTSVVGSDGAIVNISSAAAIATSSPSTSASAAVGFHNPNGRIGYILISGSATSYNTGSDYRLKNTIAPMTGALAKVAQLKPVTYKWNADGSDGEGFIAHELAEICPSAVSGEKDAVDVNGKPQYQGVDTSFLVATLTAALQELNAKFDAYVAAHP
jgi:hypothetical protein